MKQLIVRNGKLQTGSKNFSNHAAAPGMEKLRFLERLLGYLAIVVIGLAFLTMQTLYVKIMLGPTWGGRLDKYLPLLLWGLVVALFVFKLMRNETPVFPFLFPLSMLMINIILLLLRDNHTIREALLSSYFTRILLVFTLCALIASNGLLRRMLAWLIIGLAIINIVMAVWNPQSLVIARQVVLSENIFDLASQDTRPDAQTITDFMDAITGIGLAGLFYSRTGMGILIAVAICLLFVEGRMSSISVLLFGSMFVAEVLSKSRAPLFSMVFALVLMEWIGGGARAGVDIALRKLSTRSSGVLRVSVMFALAALTLVGIFIENNPKYGNILKSLGNDVADRLVLGDASKPVTSATMETMVGQLYNRLPAIEAGFSALMVNPWIGIGDTGSTKFYLKAGTVLPHFFLLDFAVRQGIPLMLFLVIQLVRAFRAFLRSARTQIRRTSTPMDIAWLGAFTVVVLSGFFHPLIDTWIFWMVLGAGLGLDSFLMTRR